MRRITVITTTGGSQFMLSEYDDSPLAELAVRATTSRSETWSPPFTVMVERSTDPAEEAVS